MNACTVFVFLSLMEYAMVNVIMGDLVDADESLVRRSIRSVRRKLTVRRRRTPGGIKVRICGAAHPPRRRLTRPRSTPPGEIKPRICGVVYQRQVLTENGRRAQYTDRGMRPDTCCVGYFSRSILMADLRDTRLKWLFVIFRNFSTHRFQKI